MQEIRLHLYHSCHCTNLLNCLLFSLFSLLSVISQFISHHPLLLSSSKLSETSWGLRKKSKLQIPNPIYLFPTLCSLYPWNIYCSRLELIYNSPHPTSNVLCNFLSRHLFIGLILSSTDPQLQPLPEPNFILTSSRKTFLASLAHIALQSNICWVGTMCQALSVCYIRSSMTSALLLIPKAKYLA